MEPRIEILKEKKLVGHRIRMSFSENKTGELWQRFMQRRDEIVDNLTTDLISLQVYDPLYFDHFDPTSEFDKWALVEVLHFGNVPDNMETFVLAGGKYAVFTYKGLSTENSIFEYIYTKWLPRSEFRLDNRPHFEILGEKYRNNDPNSEEEIWIPVISK